MELGAEMKGKHTCKASVNTDGAKMARPPHQVSHKALNYLVLQRIVVPIPKKLFSNLIHLSNEQHLLSFINWITVVVKSI